MNTIPNKFNVSEDRKPSVIKMIDYIPERDENIVEKGNKC